MLLRHRAFEGGRSSTPGRRRPPTLRVQVAPPTAAEIAGDAHVIDEDEELLRRLEDRAARLAGDAPPSNRRLSKNCRNFRRFGDRLYVRRRQRGAEFELVDDVERVREHILQLDRQMTLLDSITLSIRQNAEVSSIRMIETYYHHMQRGFHPEAKDYDRDITQPFLRIMMTDDVRCQEFSGINLFFQQWEFVTKFHSEFKMHNQSAIALPTESDFVGAGVSDCFVIKTAGLTTCRISRETLSNFFPHILQDEVLVQRLVGKEYSYGYTMIFHVNADGRVYQFESKIDLTSGLLTMLQDPSMTLKLMDSSMWTKAGNLRGALEEVREDQFEIENGFLA